MNRRTRGKKEEEKRYSLGSRSGSSLRLLPTPDAYNYYVDIWLVNAYHEHVYVYVL